MSYSDINIYIFILILITRSVKVSIYDLPVWRGCWYVFYIRSFLNYFFNVSPFDYTDVGGSGRVGSVNHLTTPVILLRGCRYSN